MIQVLVLGGGPDAERDVSIKSSTAIAAALRASGRYAAELAIIDGLTGPELAALPGDVIFPYLHGPWGEGGPLQDLVEADGRPFVGSGAAASRLAMDKVATKAAAQRCGVPTPPVWVLNPRDASCPAPYPVVVKPVHEGSTIGLSICRNPADFAAAARRVQEERSRGLHRAYMIEPKVGGERQARELTVGLIDGRSLPVIEIRPKDGLYDYEAKYHRDDTRYLVEGRDLAADPALIAAVKGLSERIFAELGLRHLARTDFMIDEAGVPWFLEINTTPGFTDHSLVPKAAAALGVGMPDLCARLVDLALRDARARPAAPRLAGAIA